MARNYRISEGNFIGGQEAQALGVEQKLITASAAITKGQVVEVTGDWTVGPAGDASVKVCGIALGDAAKDAEATVDTEVFAKLTASNAAITAGDKVCSAGDGLIRKWASDTDPVGAIIGIAIAGCLANKEAYVKLSI